MEQNENLVLFNKVKSILEKISEEQLHHKNLCAKYKRFHCILYKSHLALNTISAACCTMAAGTLTSGLGAPAGIGLSITSAITAGLGVLCNISDKQCLKKIHKHYQLCILARTLDLKLFEKYLYDDQVSAQDFSNIVTMMNDYYKQQEMIYSKSLVTLKPISELAKEFQSAYKIIV